MLVDLHSHTTASDGSYAPAQLIAHAYAVGLGAIGITDHDTIGGWEDAFAASAEYGIEVVPGVELSTSYERGRFHILGYYVRPASVLTTTLAVIQLARRNRNGEILENLRNLGFPIEEAEVRAVSGSHNGQLGRPHFALAMMKRGYVASTQEAFDRFLADGQPAYATKSVLTPQEAIGQIHEAGGVAIWAHPPLGRNCSLEELEEKLLELCDFGLDGLETYYSRYTPEEAAWTELMHERHGLLASGGSDFHGVAKPDVKLGRVQDGGSVPRSVLDAIKACRDQRRATQHASARPAHGQIV